MRRPQPDAAIALFEPIHQRTRAALERGVSICSVGRFIGRDDLPPASLLIESYGQSGFGGLVRVELLVDTNLDNILLTSMRFELIAGNTVLGRGTILVVPRRRAEPGQTSDKVPSETWQGSLEQTLWAA